MLLQSQLITLLDKVLGQSAYLRNVQKGTEAVYYCPFCHHPKKKLEINTSTQSWHCWTCNAAGKSIRSLFRKLKVNRVYYSELYKIVGKPEFVKNQQFFGERQQESTLPEEFLPLSKPSKSMEFGNAISYLRSRGVTRDDILRYNIGYAEQGEFRQRIIIPSYDKDGNLNFFSSRVYYDNDAIKYKNPPWSKDIVGFELFVNWDEPITIVESAYNAITIRRNVIPLFGKIIPPILKERIIENGVNRINVCLDKDAEQESLKLCEYLLSIETEPYFVELTKKDPNEIGFEKMNNLISNSILVDFSFLIKKKMSIL